ncbi:hypothetical protein HanOQP8_Chr08g0295031 [Helianthus annuus]|nr:hypothetical protein HanHA89_Chr08g0306871 [Helianthus annuus]KAJ0719953.1 hypothetical protein HanLR1_Chr08g0287561 [Helianthus annuus]KAJ0723177.1 hypothetical protein HanOQP8_Chr08g0295031 [Helianthus annuus]KAJ0902507.1 hypothetical protein HanPSC8_Chr08g0337841 [Helianthus annuus]
MGCTMGFGCFSKKKGSCVRFISIGFSGLQLKNPRQPSKQSENKVFARTLNVFFHC